MKTTIAFFKGPVREEHKHLQVTKFKDGYMAEEKGVSFLEMGEFSKLQNKRFDTDVDLLRIDILEPGMTPVNLLRK